MYARMVIGEAISDEQVREFAQVYAGEVLPVLKTEPGFQSSRLMIEDGGNMAVSLTVWKSRDDCLRYHSSSSYRQFVARTQHLLLGSFVVKLFKDYGGLQ
jgi:heme-degrading monooxygenase HmoA